MKRGLMSYTGSTAMKNVRAAPVLTLHGENIHLFYTSYENKIKLSNQHGLRLIFRYLPFVHMHVQQYAINSHYNIFLIFLVFLVTQYLRDYNSI